MQKLENRCDLLLIQHQKWMASVTRFIVAHGMGSPHLHGYHRLTLAHFFLPEKGTISKRLARTVLIFTERSDQLSRATDRVPGLPASPGYAQ